jgi:hypothetical protein
MEGMVMKKLFILVILFFVFSILISVNKDFNSKVQVKIGVEKTFAKLPPPPPR